MFVILVKDPVCSLVRVSSSCPAIDRLKDGRIDLAENMFRDDMPVVVCPASQLGVEKPYQTLGFDRRVGFDQCTNVIKEGFDTLPRWFYQQFSAVFTHIEPEKIEAVVDMGDVSFLCRETQPSFR